MSLLVFVFFTGLLNLLVVISLRELRGAILGDCGTLKAELFSTTLHGGGDGDHVTLFLGVLESPGLWTRCNSEEEHPSIKALTGVLRIPFRGLLMGLCFIGVPGRRGLLAGDLKGLPLRDISPLVLATTGLSATEKTCLLDEGGVLGDFGVRGVRGVLGVVLTILALPCLLGDVALLSGL